jgi:DNA mismatch repair protein MSH6
MPSTSSLTTLDDPNYDPSTIYIPKEEFAKLSEAQKQYWEIKRTHFNRIIFFQQGTFYNVFERDAEILHREFGCSYTHGGATDKILQAGINVSILEEYAQNLCNMGYAVGVVSQKKPEESASSTKKKAAASVGRKIDKFLTRGTLQDGKWLSLHPGANYLLSIKEEPIDSESRRYGVCFLDASVGEFYIGELVDDKFHSQVNAMTVQMCPIEVVYETVSTIICTLSYLFRLISILR